MNLEQFKDRVERSANTCADKYSKITIGAGALCVTLSTEVYQRPLLSTGLMSLGSGILVAAIRHSRQAKHRLMDRIEQISK